MTTRFIRSGTSFHTTSNAALDLYDQVPAGFYILSSTPKQELYLDTISPFVSPEKVYGSLTYRRDRILNTFFDRETSTGVLLTGKKGSGKTLLAREIAISAVNKGIPVIVVNSPYCGDTFNTFIQSIRQECVIMFDEFEKVYEIEAQQKMLTLLDGTFTSKKLFLFTTNEAGRNTISSYLIDRPGRIYYSIDFEALEAEQIIGYCQDVLKAKEHINTIVTMCQLFDFNFDMLKALIEEMNRYGESPDKAIELLNAKGRQDIRNHYTMTVHTKADNETYEKYREQELIVDPFSSEIRFVELTNEEEEETEDFEDTNMVTFGIDNLVRADVTSSTYFYEKENYMIILKKKENKRMDNVSRYRTISSVL